MVVQCVRRWPFWVLCVCSCECTCNEPATTTAHNCSTHSHPPPPACTRTLQIAVVLASFRRRSRERAQRSVHLLSAPDPVAEQRPPTHHPRHAAYPSTAAHHLPRPLLVDGDESETAKQTRFGINQRWSTIYIVGCFCARERICVTQNKQNQAFCNDFEFRNKSKRVCKHLVVVTQALIAFQIDESSTDLPIFLSSVLTFEISKGNYYK